MMTRYSSLCELLEAYRKSLPRPLSQESLAKSLGVSVRTYHSWKRDSHFGTTNQRGNTRSARDLAQKNGSAPISRTHLADIAKATHLPMEALIRLSYGYPTWLSLTSNRYANGPFDQSFVVGNVLRKGLFHAGTDDDGVRHLEKGDMLVKLFTLHTRLFSHVRQLEQDVIAEAVERSPMTNLIVNDQHGFYCGHIITLALNEHGYARLRYRQESEASLKVEDLAASAEETVALHIYSSLAVHATYAYRIWRRLVSYFIADPILVRMAASGCELSRVAVTRDSEELCQKLELVHQYFDHQYNLAHVTEVRPAFYSRALRELEWLTAYQERNKSLRD